MWSSQITASSQGRPRQSACPGVVGPGDERGAVHVPLLPPRGGVGNGTPVRAARRRRGRGPAPPRAPRTIRSPTASIGRSDPCRRSFSAVQSGAQSRKRTRPSGRRTAPQSGSVSPMEPRLEQEERARGQLRHDSSARKPSSGAGSASRRRYPRAAASAATGPPGRWNRHPSWPAFIRRSSASPASCIRSPRQRSVVLPVARLHLAALGAQPAGIAPPARVGAGVEEAVGQHQAAALPDRDETLDERLERLVPGHSGPSPSS
jgi:hypothetical protein